MWSQTQAGRCHSDPLPSNVGRTLSTSKQANGSFVKGDRGRDGSEGSVDERREPVTIP